MSDIEENNQPVEGQQFTVEIGDAEGMGIYSNLAIIRHSAAEFVIDFTRFLPDIPKARVQSRIIMTPYHAKLLWLALGENIRGYESFNGEIHVQQNAPPFSAASETIN